MKVLAEVEFTSEEAAMIAGRFRTTEQIFQNQKFPSGTYNLMGKANVYQYGRYWDSIQEVPLPATVVETAPSLIDGAVVSTTLRHKLSDGELYGVGSAANYHIETETETRNQLTPSSLAVVATAQGIYGRNQR